ncbi:MAG: phytoene desaturase family protein, partial [Asgard group archaeon]|nr:phytoene desaturase family protein [Asgard group archaeon]
MDKKERIAIIGAGFGGLSAAALLAKEGYKITIYEKNDRPGGRARVFKEKGFKFDMGPSWYLMPDVFETFFGEFDKSPSDYFELVRLNPAYKMIFGKGDEITISSNLEENFKLFDQIENNGAEKMKKYLKLAKFQYEVSINEILYKNINSIFTLMRPNLLVKGLKLNIFSNLKSKIDKIFESERMKKILLYSVVFLGGDPKNTPAIYSLMSHVDFNMGVWYPKGGIGVVVEALVKLNEKYGAQIEYNKEINQILVENKTVKGVKIGDQEI